MAIFTFSTRTKRPVDTALVQRVKDHCDKHGLNFSALIIQLLKQWEEENAK